ncbi:hypothetical protein BH20ACT24_BH20ACT24_10220 [soil metagenome]
MFGHTLGDPGRFNVNVYADGRLIWQRLGDSRGDGNPNTTGLIEQRLTLEGVELVRSEVLSTGLFDHDLHFMSAHGLLSGDVRVLSGDRLVRVTWGDIGPDDAAMTLPTGTGSRPPAARRATRRSVVLAAGERVGEPGAQGLRALHVLGLL